MEKITSLGVDLKDIVKQIEELKKGFEDTDKVTEDFDNTLEQLQKKLKELKSTQLKVDVDSTAFVEYNQQIAELETTIRDIKQTGKDAFNAIAESTAQSRLDANEYANTMDGLKQKLKDLNSVKGKIDIDSEAFKNVSEEIFKVNQQLKDIEASQNIFSRNVGNYANSFVAAFGKMGGAASTVANGIQAATASAKNFGTELKALGKNPYIAAIAVALAAILAMFQTMKKAINGNEETTRKWEQAIAKLQPLFDAVSNVIENIGSLLVDTVTPALDALATVVNAITNKFYDLAEIFGKVFGSDTIKQWAKESKKAFNDNIERQKELINLEHQLTDLKRKNITQIANLEAQSASLREKANDTETYNASQRKKFADEAHQLEQQALQLKRQQIALEVQIAEERAKATANSKEDNDALAEKKKLLIEVDKEIAQNNAQYNKQNKRFVQEQNQEILKSLDTNKQISSAKKSLYDENSVLYKFYQKQELKADYEKSKKEIEISKVSQKQKNELLKNLYQQYRKELFEIDVNFQKKENENLVSSYENALKLVNSNTKEYYTLQQQELEKELSNYQNIIAKYLKTTNNVEYTKAFLEQVVKAYDVAFNNELPLTIKGFTDFLKQNQDEVSKLMKLDNWEWGETDEWIISIKQQLINLKDTYGLTLDDIASTIKLFQKDISNVSENTKILDFDNSLNNIKSQIYDLDSIIEESNNNIYLMNMRYAELYRQLAEGEYDNIVQIGQLSTETVEQFEQRKYEARKKWIDAADVYEQSRIELRANTLFEQDQYLNSEDPSLHYDEELTALHAHLLEMQAELEVMQKKEYESREQFEKRKQRLQKKYNRLQEKEEKLTWSKRLSVINQGLNSMGSIFSSIADLYEADAEADANASEEKKKAAEEAFETQKAFQRAAAIVSMLSGALGISAAYLKEESFQPSWIRPALAAAQYTATLMQGMVTLRQINATHFGSDSVDGGGSSQVDAAPVSFSNVAVNPLLDENVDSMTAPNIKTDTDDETQDTRVYILQSDLETSSKQVKVREQSTTF